jgi:hypothetical protein
MPRYDPNKPGTIAEFERLCSLEPRLRALYEEASAVKDDPSRPSFCRHNHWRGKPLEQSLLMRMKKLVGDGAGYPEPTPDTLGVGELLADKQPANPFARGAISAADIVRMGKEDAERIPGFPVDLTTSAAYDVAYSVLFERLPPCRNCGCS